MYISTNVRIGYINISIYKAAMINSELSVFCGACSGSPPPPFSMSSDGAEK